MRRREWAVGMKMVIELPDRHDAGSRARCGIRLGIPSRRFLAFLYVHPERLVSVGIFVPSWMGTPARTAYRYLQHFIQHPVLWRYLKDGTLRSWGAKSLEESGSMASRILAAMALRALAKAPAATNMLTGSGVDEAWATGMQLAEAVVELLRAGKAFTRENLAATYEARRRASCVESGAQAARMRVMDSMAAWCAG